MSSAAISGLKVSGGLSLLTLQSHGLKTLAALIQALAGRQINLAFAAVAASSNNRFQACLAVASAEVKRVHSLLAETVQKSRLPDFEVTPHVAAITLYPRDKSLGLAAAAVTALGEQGITPAAMGTSHSALVTFLEAEACPGAVAALSSALGLPPGASPARARLEVIQVPRHEGGWQGETVAVYAEHPIRTYGLEAKPGYALIRAQCALGHLGKAGSALINNKLQQEAAFVSAQTQGGIFFMQVCTREDGAIDLAAGLRWSGWAATGTFLPASLIHLQGPHFGDRY
ncbi:MAG: hypothetical protein PVG60_01120, partial [Desulfarculaceae bacterium]